LKGSRCVVQTVSGRHISLDIFNSAGKKVHALCNDVYKAGRHYFMIPKNEMAKGYYMVRFLSGNEIIQKPYINR